MQYAKYISKLPSLPPSVDLSAASLSLSIRFGGAGESSSCLLWTNPESKAANALMSEPWDQCVREGNKHLAKRPAFFSLVLPLNSVEGGSARLHIATPLITTRDLEHFVGIEQRQDFDRLMDVVQQITLTMVEASLVQPKANSIDIVPELFNHKGKIRFQPVAFIADAIAATWLRSDKEGLLFKGYRYWNALTKRWSRESTL